MRNNYETHIEEVREAKIKVHEDFQKSGEKDLKKFLKKETVGFNQLYRKKVRSA